MTESRWGESQISEGAEQLLNVALSDMRQEVIGSATRMAPPGQSHVTVREMHSALQLLGVGRFRRTGIPLPASRTTRILVVLGIVVVLAAASGLSWLIGDTSNVELGATAIGFVAGLIVALIAYVVVRGAVHQDTPPELTSERANLETRLLTDWGQVEKLMREAVGRSSERELERIPVSSIYSKYFRDANASESELRSFHELRNLRNSLVHGGSESVSSADLKRGIDVAQALLKAMRSHQ
jgi:Flp pilus assembly pilin Flp